MHMDMQVSLHGGAANKNIGDAFLLVWKLAGSKRDRDRDASRRSSLACSRSQGSGMSRASSGGGLGSWVGGWGAGDTAHLCRRRCLPRPCGSPTFTCCPPPSVCPPSAPMPLALGPAPPTPPAERISVLIGTDREDSRREEVANIADQALASFVVIQAALKRSQKLKEFCAR